MFAGNSSLAVLFTIPGLLSALSVLHLGIVSEGRADEQPTARDTRGGRMPMLSNDDAWKRLPGPSGSAVPLPTWARMLAGPLPLATARMLELDALHRSGDRLDARFRGLVRWAAADANSCAYTKAMALADLRRAGCPELDLQTMVLTPEKLPLADRAAMTFARTMMREAHAVTDADVKQLIEILGEQRVVALVAMMAHASFQDRMLLALNAPVEPEPLPPIARTFTLPKPAGPPGAAAKRDDVLPGDAAKRSGPSWLDLQTNLEKQRAREGRIRVPSTEEVIKRLGANHPAAWQSGILWSRVCYGFQPELTDAWFNTVSAFRQETALDRIFSQCLFWVVTDSIQCFY